MQFATTVQEGERRLDVEGVDVFQLDDDGLAVEMRVMLRPLRAVHAVVAGMEERIRVAQRGPEARTELAAGTTMRRLTCLADAALAPAASTPGQRLRTLRLHAATARRTIRRYGVHPTRMLRRLDERVVFVVGSPRSGTSFTAIALGGVTGFADLGEVNALKAAVPELTARPVDEAAARARAILTRSQRLGMVAGLRAIEQTPEATFVIPALAQAFPEGLFLHLQRDGRDVVSSLVESAWMRPAGERELARDDAGQPYGDHARFWVEPERRAEFAAADEATRCAWVWRRYETVAQSLLAVLPARRSLTVRYEQLVLDPGGEAARVAEFLGVSDRGHELADEFGRAFATSVGRYDRDLAPSALDAVEREAGELLRTLGYVAPA